jgi:hypothetical protein
MAAEERSPPPPLKLPQRSVPRIGCTTCAILLPKPQPTPDRTADQMREDLLDRPPAPIQRSPDNFARGNSAAAFDLQQQHAKFNYIPNPLIDALELELFKPMEAIAKTEDYNCGAAWAIDSLAQEVTGFRFSSLLPIEVLGVDAVAQAAWLKFVTSKPLERVEAIASQFKENQLTRLLTIADGKLKAIATERSRWMDQAKIPVLNCDGSVIESLTLVNLATVAIGVQKLDELRSAVSNFRNGAEFAMSRLEDAGKR